MKNKGVTLLVLVITIVVLLILAGITLSLTIGGNGWVGEAKEAKTEFNLAQLKDEVAVAYSSYATRLKSKRNLTLGDILEEIPNAEITEIGEGSWLVTKGESKVLVDSNGNISVYDITVTLSEAKDNSMLEKTMNSELELTDGTVTIPAGYKVTTDSGDTVDAGVVITDAASNGNEWVWVPVERGTGQNGKPTLKDIVYTESVEGDNTVEPAIVATNKLYGVNVTTSKYSKTDIISGIFRVYPGTGGSYKEPDVVRSYQDYDNNANNRIAAGFSTITNGIETALTLEEMAQIMVDEYEQMIRSLEQYGGFYIGRYELSLVGVKKGESTLTGISWYDFYKICKNLSANSTKSMSRMIWGCQWDLTCKYIGEALSSDSRTWGNFSNSLSPANVVVDGVNKYGERQVTGYSEYWKAKNIYDFAGNCHEWTQEACQQYYRARRDGYYNGNGESNPASYRTFGSPTNSSEMDTGTRPVLIILPTNN